MLLLSHEFHLESFVRNLDEIHNSKKGVTRLFCYNFVLATLPYALVAKVLCCMHFEHVFRVLTFPVIRSTCCSIDLEAPVHLW